MVMSIGWNPFYKNIVRSVVSWFKFHLLLSPLVAIAYLAMHIPFDGLNDLP